MHLSLLKLRLDPNVRADVVAVQTFGTLIAFQGIGELLARVMGVPIPGPVIGMVLLVGVLAGVPSVGERLARPALGLLNHLSLLFVPAGVGVIGLASALKDQLLAILFAIIASTALSVAVTALVTCAMLTRRNRIGGSAARSVQTER